VRVPQLTKLVLKRRRRSKESLSPFSISEPLVASTATQMATLRLLPPARDTSQRSRECIVRLR
jgi:hypothetical protein